MYKSSSINKLLVPKFKCKTTNKSLNLNVVVRFFLQGRREMLDQGLRCKIGGAGSALGWRFGRWRTSSCEAERARVARRGEEGSARGGPGEEGRETNRVRARVVVEWMATSFLGVFRPENPPFPRPHQSTTPDWFRIYLLYHRNYQYFLRFRVIAMMMMKLSHL